MMSGRRKRGGVHIQIMYQTSSSSTPTIARTSEVHKIDSTQLQKLVLLFSAHELLDGQHPLNPPRIYQTSFTLKAFPGIPRFWGSSASMYYLVLLYSTKGVTCIHSVHRKISQLVIRPQECAMSYYSKHLTVTMVTFIVLTGGTSLVRCDHVICKLCHQSS